MRALQADGDFAAVLVSLKEFSYLAVVVGIVEDVGGWKAISIANLHQSLHDDFEQAAI